MNRTQKTAWLNLSGFLANVTIFGYLLITILALKRLPNRLVILILLLLFGVPLAWGIFALRRKQSPAEPEADERDKTIMRNAVLASFFSTWLFLAVATLIPAFTLGQEGSLPVFLLPFIHFGVFCMAALVYFAAVLVQYGRARKGELK